MAALAAPDGPDADDLLTMIADTAAGVFADVGAIGSDAARAAAEAAIWHDAGWRTLVDAGFVQAMRDEADGGVGTTAALTIVRLAGAAAVALPLPEAMAADWLLAQVGRPPAARPMVFVPAPVSMEQTGTGVRVAGTVEAVPWARSCDLVCIGLSGGGPVLVTLGRDDFTVTEGRNLADEPRDRVTFDHTVAEGEVATLPAGFDADTPLRLGAVLRTAQIAGAVEATVRMTVGYVRDRAQFGRPLAGFQAVQQLLAVMAGEAAAARVAADLAGRALVVGLGFEAIAGAKIRAGEAAGKIAAAAHQLHGAIGFTREHALQLLTRRLWSWRDEFGSEAHWSTALGKSLASGQRPLWAAITDI